MHAQRNRPTLRAGETVLIVKRSRVLAGLPAIEGVISDVHLKGERVYAVSAKVSAAKPHMFPVREVCVSGAHAQQTTRAIINDAEDDALITYARSKTLIDHARHEDAARAIAAATVKQTSQE